MRLRSVDIFDDFQRLLFRFLVGHRAALGVAQLLHVLWRGLGFKSATVFSAINESFDSGDRLSESAVFFGKVLELLRLFADLVDEVRYLLLEVGAPLALAHLLFDRGSCLHHLLGLTISSLLFLGFFHLKFN